MQMPIATLKSMCVWLFGLISIGIRIYTPISNYKDKELRAPTQSYNPALPSWVHWFKRLISSDDRLNSLLTGTTRVRRILEDVRGFLKLGYPKYGWFMTQNDLTRMIWGYPLLWETSRFLAVEWISCAMLLYVLTKTDQEKRTAEYGSSTQERFLP